MPRIETPKLAEIAAQEAEGKDIELWFQDEARIGQKNKITRRWARRGIRPRAPHDQRTRSAYIFGAICPSEGKGAGLVLRGRIEKIFGTCKQHYGLRRMAHRGIVKAILQVMLTAIAYNLKRGLNLQRA